MIKPEQVPDVVFDAFQKAWSHKSTLSTKECLAAALNAWPGMKKAIPVPYDEYDWTTLGPIDVPQAIILPLTEKPE